MSNRKARANAYARKNCPVVQELGLQGPTLRLYTARQFGRLKELIGRKRFRQLYAVHSKHYPDEVRKARERSQEALQPRRSKQSGLVYTQRKEKPRYKQSFSEGTYTQSTPTT